MIQFNRFTYVSISILYLILMLGCSPKQDFIYEDPIEGFTLKLPPEWSSNEGYVDNTSTSKGIRKIIFWDGEDPKFGKPAHIIVLINNNSYIDKERMEGLTHLDTPKKNIKIDSIDVEMIKHILKRDGNLLSIRFYFEKNGNFFSISISSERSDKEIEELSDRIINTLKFIR